MSGVWDPLASSINLNETWRVVSHRNQHHHSDTTKAWQIPVLDSVSLAVWGYGWSQQLDDPWEGHASPHAFAGLLQRHHLPAARTQMSGESLWKFTAAVRQLTQHTNQQEWRQLYRLEMDRVQVMPCDHNNRLSVPIARPDITMGLFERKLSLPYMLKMASRKTISVLKEALVELTLGHTKLPI